MRILVIDDQMNFAWGLRGILEGHEVTGVHDPAALPRVLAHEEPFDQAIVDLRFPMSEASGLTALATLRERSPRTRTIVTTTDWEENRLLYLLAAFQFFEPKAMLAKDADAFTTRAIVGAVGRGEPAPNADADPYRRAAAIRPPLLDQVVGDKNELGMWQELTRFDKRQEIANAAHVHPRTLDTFTAAKCAAIDTVTDHFPQLRRGHDTQAAAGTAVRAAAHGANLIKVIHFARTHAEFFLDNEVAGLLRRYWRPR